MNFLLHTNWKIGDTWMQCTVYLCLAYSFVVRLAVAVISWLFQKLSLRWRWNRLEDPVTRLYINATQLRHGTVMPFDIAMLLPSIVSIVWYIQRRQGILEYLGGFTYLILISLASTLRTHIFQSLDLLLFTSIFMIPRGELYNKLSSLSPVS